MFCMYVERRFREGEKKKRNSSYGRLESSHDVLYRVVDNVLYLIIIL